MHFGQREGSTWVTVRRGARYRVGGRRGKMCVGLAREPLDIRISFTSAVCEPPSFSPGFVDDGYWVGATRVRTSEADLASLWGRDMLVTWAALDIQTRVGVGRKSAPRGCFLCRSAERWARVEACGYASSGRFGRPNEQIREVVERHGPSSRPRGLRRALRLGTANNARFTEMTLVYYSKKYD